MVARPSTCTYIHFQLSVQSYCTDNNVLHHHDDMWRHETARVARWRASCSCSVFCGRVSTSSDSWWSGVALRTPPGHFSSPTEVYKRTHFLCEIYINSFQHNLNSEIAQPIWHRRTRINPSFTCALLIILHVRVHLYSRTSLIAIL